MTKKRRKAIAGIGICGLSICGDCSCATSDIISESDIKAVAKITSEDGWFIYNFPIIGAEIILNQPYDNDGCTVSIVHSGQIKPGASIEIGLGKGIKRIIFKGVIQTETKNTYIKKGSILSEFSCIHSIDEINHRYFESDVSFNGNIKEVARRFAELAPFNYDNRINNTHDVVGDTSTGVDFKAFDVTLIEALKTLLSEFVYIYIEGDKLVLSDKDNKIKFRVDENSKIISYKNDKSQINQYRECRVYGTDYSGNEFFEKVIDESVNTNKILLIRDDSIKTAWAAKNRARLELENNNEKEEQIEIRFSGLIISEFGLISINLPSVKTISELKSIRYEIDSNGIFTTFYIGRNYKSLRNIFEKMIS